MTASKTRERQQADQTDQRTTLLHWLERTPKAEDSGEEAGQVFRRVAFDRLPLEEKLAAVRAGARIVD